LGLDGEVPDHSTFSAIIIDVEATTAIRQAELLAAKRMVERAMELMPRRGWRAWPSPTGSAYRVLCARPDPRQAAV